MQEITLVPLRLFQLPCCRFRLLWVEAAPPRVCPMCGTACAALETLLDVDASLTYEAGE